MTFLRVLGEMWGVYTSTALPFLLIHIFVLATVIWLFAEIRKEIRALDACPAGPARGECARTLEQFVNECRVWGARGVFVPVTDFSDRLDSHVTGYIESLHSRVNLFLVVGVAGTFFAMFQFALKVSGSGADVARSLREGLILAFPVGFFGLLWTLAGHYAAFAQEQKLRRAVNGAIQRVMGQRQAYSHSVLDEISSALKPLTDLQGTLAETLQPVLESLRAELKPMGSAMDGFRAAAESLREPGLLLAEAAREVPRALDGIAAVQAQARRDLQELAAVFQEARAALAGLSDASSRLVASYEQLGGISSEIVSKFEHHTSSLAERCLTVWERQGDRFARDAAASFAALCSNIDSASREAKATLGEAANDLNRVSGQVASILEDSLAQLFGKVLAEVKPHLRSLDEAMGERYPRLLEELGTAADRAQMLVERVEIIRKELDAAAARLQEAAIRIGPPVELTTGIGEIKTELQKTRDFLSTRFGRKPLKDLWTRFRPTNRRGR